MLSFLIICTHTCIHTLLTLTEYRSGDVAVSYWQADAPCAQDQVQIQNRKGVFPVI